MSAVNKLNYIFETLNSLGYGVDIISMARSETSELRYETGLFEKVGQNTLKLFGSFGGKSNPIIRVFDRLIGKTKFFLYLLNNIKSNEEVIVYHSTGYSKLILWAKKIKGFRIIGEIEEIYQDVIQLPAHVKKTEYRFFKACDKYIFPTSLLNEKLNLLNKPYIIIHGAYKIEIDRGERFNDGKTHVVYAGTFDPNKGCICAAEAAEYLPKNYHIHILGFGNNHDTEVIKEKIEEMSKQSEAALSFHGLLRGEEYIKFIQKCEIGLSPQNPTAAFNSTSFPSKILSYMANGLDVVTIDIPAIRDSIIGDSLFYYAEQSPQKIAEAIQSIKNLKKHSTKDILKECHLKFKKDINSLISK